MKRAGLVFLALGLGVGGATSCGGNDEVTIVLLDPCAGDGGGISFRDSSVYTEIAVVKNGCPSDEDLAAGDLAGVAFSGVVPSDSPSLPEIGALDKGSYGFVVLLKDANCGVIGFGCTAADLENIREVRIAVRAWTNGTNTCQPLTGGSCPTPKTCEEGRCVGESSGDSGGGGCDLTVVKAGKLPALASAGSELNGPGIVATSTGFVIGYREYGTDGKITARLIPLSDAGALGAGSSVPISTCAGQSLSGGVGLAYAGSQGLMALSLPDCADAKGAGAAFIPFDTSAVVGGHSTPRNPGFQALALARDGALAPATQPNDWEFVYRATLTAGPSVERGIVRGIDLLGTPPILPLFGGQPADFGMVVTSSAARAFIGAVPGDGGKSTIAEFSKVEPTQGDVATPVGQITLPGSSFAAATAWNDRVVVGVPGTAGLTYSAVKVAATGISPLVTDETIGTGSVAGADVFAHGDNLLFALGSSGQIGVHRLTGALGTLASTASDTQTLSGTEGAVSLTSFDGQRLAIAAGRNRAAVVWLTSQSPSASDPPGGYAVLQCAK